MALAILRFLSMQDGLAKFRIDTGTNPFYLLKIGEGSYNSNGFDFIDGVSIKTGLKKNDKSETLFDTDTEISIPADSFSKENCFVQLFSFKDKAGTSPAFSKVVKVRVALNLPSSPPDEYSFSSSLNMNAMSNQRLNSHRNIPFAEAKSLENTKADYEDLLRAMMKIAGPVILGMLTGFQQKRPSSSNRMRPQIGMFNTILNTFLHGWSNPQRYIPAVSQSLSGTRRINNRFAASTRSTYARPFDTDAGIATTAPPMPAFQDDALIKSLFEEVQKEAMLKLFLESQETAGAPNPLAGIDINQLMKFLQQAPAPTPAPAPNIKPAVTTPPVAPTVTAPVQPTVTAPVQPTVTTPPVVTGAPTVTGTPTVTTPPVAITKSLSRRSYPATLSNKAMLSFETSSKMIVNEKEQVVFSKNADIKLKVKFNVAGEAPKTPLPKAIVNFSFKDKDNKVLFEKMFKQKDVLANDIISYTFSMYELQPLPVGTPLAVIAEMRWLTSKNTEVKALGNIEIVLADTYFPKSPGKAMGEEKELNDMNTYRPFWNKVWESPVLDNVTAGEDGIKKQLWSLQANLKYCVLVSGTKESNGLMNTKLSLNEKETGNMTDKTEGKLKTGIELSVTELNKLSGLWNRQPVSDPARLAALKTSQAITGVALDCIFNISLKGKARERGMLWVVPVLRLYDFYINKIKTVDESGQVTEAEEETVQLPMPVSVRFLGIKSI